MKPGWLAGVECRAQRIGYNMATPTDASGVRQMVGMASFYRRWLPSFATMVSPLTDMLRMRDDPTGRIDPKTKKVRRVMIDFKEHWGPKQDKAVTDVKNMMTSYPVLRQFDPTKPCVLLTDGSLIGVGSVLCQEHEGKLAAISYASHRLTEAEANQNRGVGRLVREQMEYDETTGELLDAAPYPGVYEYAAQEQHQFDHPERMRAIFQTAREAMITAITRPQRERHSADP